MQNRASLQIGAGLCVCLDACDRVRRRRPCGPTDHRRRAGLLARAARRSARRLLQGTRRLGLRPRRQRHLPRAQRAGRHPDAVAHHARVPATGRDASRHHLLGGDSDGDESHHRPPDHLRRRREPVRHQRRHESHRAPAQRHRRRDPAAGRFGARGRALRRSRRLASGARCSTRPIRSPSTISASRSGRRRSSAFRSSPSRARVRRTLRPECRRCAHRASAGSCRSRAS